MGEKDIHIIKQLLAQQSLDVQAKMEQLEANLDQKMELRQQSTDKKMKQLSLEFQRYVGVLADSLDVKISLVAESHQVLHDEIKETRSELKKDINLCGFKIDTVNDKVDAVAADVKQHRNDTEAHQNMYCVKER